MKRLLVLILIAAIAVFSAVTVSAYDGVSVRKIEFKNPDFIRGMDVSSVISLEQAGVKFYNHDGQKEDIFKILSSNGVNYIRVRVWNSPFDKDGNGYGGGNNDVATAREIGRRAARYGMKLLVDFHYSDFWADPAKQKAPKAWQNLSLSEKEAKLKEFTYNSLQEIKSAGADIGMVQIGNETTTGICGESEWQNMARLFNAGASAVRAFDGKVLIAVHFTNPERTDYIKKLADFLNDYNVDYDVFATSYYPYWHGSLENLSDVLGYACEKYGKYAIVAETSYANTLTDTDGHPNTVNEWNNSTGENLLWDFSYQGQADALSAVMSTVNSVKKGLGVFYWEGAWITVGNTAENPSQVEKNKELWERFGCGWAASYSCEYDPDDAGKWYGGSAVDNQAFFDSSGRALRSLEVFKMISQSALIGDVNGDGKINITDATAIRKNVSRLCELDSRAHRAADINRDGELSVSDATALQMYLAGYKTEHTVAVHE